MDVMTIIGMSCSCCSVGTVTITTEGGNSAKISVLVAHGKPLGYDLLLGIDAIRALGGVAVRPVMDFQKLNHHVDAFTANADVCATKLPEWRQKGSNMSLLDLRRAYLQVHIHESLWPFQTMKIDGRRYCLTCLEFGLNVAPLIMKVIISTVLARDTTMS